jgi:2-C-methyl-D-erythritol 4-phosphate cytidylyltransferase
MWRSVVLGWAELPGSWRARLHAVLDVAAEAGGDGWVVVDERCPGLDRATLRGLLEEARRDGRARLGVRPVTDTVKEVREGTVTGTVDRSGLVQVASPLVVPATYGEPVGDSLVAMAAGLGDVLHVEVPAHARPLADVDELRLLAG